MIALLALPPPPVVMERRIEWSNPAEEIAFAEVERLTYRREGAGWRRERALVRTEVEGASVPPTPGLRPENLAPGESSKDPLTARLDRAFASRPGPVAWRDAVLTLRGTVRLDPSGLPTGRLSAPSALLPGSGFSARLTVTQTVRPTAPAGGG